MITTLCATFLSSQQFLIIIMRIMLTFVSLLMMIDFEGQISTSEMKSIPPCINTYSTQDLIFRTDMICVKKKSRGRISRLKILHTKSA